ncbi:MAG: cytochrome B6 [Gammaproteobacteria bacterium]|nr:MAG: cytochrome B6 [Gammaproteobacteria bacterium]
MTRQLKIFAVIGLTAILAASPLLAGKPLNEPIKPIPASIDVDPKKVTLGRKLFHDNRLSKNNTVSCASCHDLAHGGADGVQVSTGVEGQQGPINAPTVYNTAFLFRLFWDGRAENLEEQIDGPVQNPVEMGSLWPDIVAKLYEDAEYPKQFKDTFGSGISRKNIKSALAEFQRSLITPNSRFDQYLLGDENAITELEKTGYQNFKNYGCISCHQGAAVGGNMFQLFGVANSYFQTRGNITKADMGRFNVTGNVMDKHTFKVPSLRLAALTPPYLHDGNAATLRDAVNIMFKFQLGREAPDEDKDAIVAFIKTLAGEHPEMKK